MRLCWRTDPQTELKLIHARSRAPAWSALWQRADRHSVRDHLSRHLQRRESVQALLQFRDIRGDRSNSQWTADHIGRRIASEDPRRGVDLEEFDPAGVSPDRIAALRARWNVGEGQMIVLLPGRLTRWKGQLVFLAALAQLARASALDNVRRNRRRCSGVPNARSPISRSHCAATAWKMCQSCRTLPICRAAYLANDIVVSASTDPEAFGRAEAVLMGRPVIASDHGGARSTGAAQWSAAYPAQQYWPPRVTRRVRCFRARRELMGGKTPAHNIRANFSRTNVYENYCCLSPPAPWWRVAYQTFPARDSRRR